MTKEPEYRRYDPWEPYPYCDCGRIQRNGTCRVCDAKPASTDHLTDRGFSKPEVDV